ncbi:MAG: acyl-CoA dehydrogenase family protein [Desulfatiglans sp.]|jgi:alkylation response protein AidB-like acyl-CoA dehydrogenase|nr:acyl-CoA dehydrogenase family protein [Desulfatiglans sp.]
MDYTFDEEQIMLVDTARKFFEKKAPPAVLRELLAEEKGYLPDVWTEMGELGWTGLVFSEEYGGYEARFVDLAVIFEEMGRAAFQSPFFATVVLSGLLIQDSGTEDIKNIYLPKIAGGGYISTLALVGQAGHYHKDDVAFEAEPVDGGYRISGTSIFVPYAHVADNIICAAKTPSVGPGAMTLFAVDAKSPGVETKPMKTVAGDGNECVVRIKDVDVSKAQIIGEAGKGWESIENLLPRISALLSCECLGGMDKVVEMTVNHVNERIQFGKPLSAFQAVQHMMADMSCKTETSRHVAHYAAWRISEGIESEKEAATAKAYCGEAFKDVTKLAHQVSGGIGFTEEYDLHLYTRNAKKLELLFGNGSFHRNRVADKLGL